jgi:hypothetical protein
LGDFGQLNSTVWLMHLKEACDMGEQVMGRKRTRTRVVVAGSAKRFR